MRWPKCIVLESEYLERGIENRLEELLGSYMDRMRTITNAYDRSEGKDREKRATLRKEKASERVIHNTYRFVFEKGYSPAEALRAAQDLEGYLDRLWSSSDPIEPVTLVRRGGEEK